MTIKMQQTLGFGSNFLSLFGLFGHFLLLYDFRLPDLNQWLSLCLLPVLQHYLIASKGLLLWLWLRCLLLLLLWEIPETGVVNG